MEPNAYKRMAEIQSDHWWFVARRSILSRLIKSLGLPENSEILEAGCGPGGNLAMLSQFGEVYGFDPDKSARDFAMQQGTRHVAAGFLPKTIPFIDKQFDLVCAFDVIEHLDEEEASLIALKAKVKPGGYALFTVPAHPFLWSSHDLRHHHKRRYNKKQFEANITRAGFEIRKSSWFNCFLFPIVVMIRSVNRIRANSDHDDEAIPWRPINKLLTLIFELEGFLLRYFNLPFGVSIVLLASVDSHRPQIEN